jgi:hypothetical protein
MKTKFSALVTFRKQSVDKIERHIASLNMEINRTKEKIAHIKQEIIDTPIPQSGNFYQISCMKEMVNAHRRELQKQEIVLIQLRDDKQKLQKSLKDAYLEYEKAKHLDNLEKQKAIAKKKQEEAAYIDEIALILHNNKKKS